MATDITDITDYAILGYKASSDLGGEPPYPANPLLRSSPGWMGYEAGMTLARKGFTVPTKVTMGRGYSVNVWTAANRFRVGFDSNLIPYIERLGEG